ncbi:aspartate--ammonia ligase [Erysipelothrix rhusiopathiae]|nr:aspartate--ammonia ligase [Erysipelothrix rhusiopathiae]MDE8042680.1 aspartate--ammonia ligase [Erysipelothrix rhusiopathiae]MDE8049081.1 aspartate--ammonia ligase [Erysipelothrix rhusiopathiae]MDE8058951.1 aspartate--ammonia ligase [Erysipelothrix rhusiopathiae]MDE8067118.1 aspartate--ammonia ligase [Erysipelothrix rhusiopathiae]
MKKTIVPEGYQSRLGVYDTQTAIGFIKRCFEEALTGSLKLKRVSAPLFVARNSGLNDDLNGVERPVRFDVPSLDAEGEVVHSLAKWKRMALHQYDFREGNGLYTDMNAIRRDEELDNIHSIYVDQWDWERVISREQRTLDYLKDTVQSIVNAIVETSSRLHTKYQDVDVMIDSNVAFITSQELEDLYPNLSSKERENAYVKEHHTTFIIQIGDKLKSGKPHDNRAPDYDDWSLNGDLLFWHEPLGIALELSSMGIRVNRDAMLYQLKEANQEDRLKYDFHKMIVDDELPLTIGGGIGQSRMCMLLLGNAHIGEVQVSLWDDETLDTCKGKIELL